ncbi:putative protein isoform X1 [Capsicum galapagoense]
MFMSSQTSRETMIHLQGRPGPPHKPGPYPSREEIIAHNPLLQCMTRVNISLETAKIADFLYLIEPNQLSTSQRSQRPHFNHSPEPSIPLSLLSVTPPPPRPTFWLFLLTFTTWIHFVIYRIFMEFVVDDHVNGEEEEGTVVELRAVDENVIGGSSSEEALQQVHDVKVDEDLPEREDLLLEEAQCLDNSTSDEPYVGLEFESEAAAHAFYNAYATRVGFIIRVSKLSRSRRDGSAIGRALVCNKEGFRMPDKREKIVRQRAETRVGCRAMILVRKVNSGKWVVTKFVKEHSHPLCPGKGRRDLIYDQYPNEHDKIRELSQQLAAEKKRSATYKRHLEMIFEHIEEHNQSLSKKIQDIVHNVREMESKDQHHHR